MSAASPKPHPHAAVLAEWLKDTTLPLWFWDTASEPGPKWSVLDGHNLVTMGSGYRVSIGSKPTAPPQRMCVLAGVEFPEPLREAPPFGVTVYLPSMLSGTDVEELTWTENCAVERLINAGLCHLDEDAAADHALALLAATKQAVEAAR